MKRYIKKPVVIEAIQYLGLRQNSVEILNFTDNKVFFEAVKNPVTRINESCDCVIPTLEGNMIAEVGDWIIKGIKGEFYPCKPDIFELTYDEETK